MCVEGLEKKVQTSNRKGQRLKRFHNADRGEVTMTYKGRPLFWRRDTGNRKHLTGRKPEVMPLPDGRITPPKKKHSSGGSVTNQL